jgi:hypothetical protein
MAKRNVANARGEEVCMKINGNINEKAMAIAFLSNRSINTIIAIVSAKPANRGDTLS